MVELLPEFRRRPLLPPQPGPPGDPLAAWSREAKRALLYPLRPRTAFFLLSGAALWTFAEGAGVLYLRIFTFPALWIFVAFIYAMLVNVLHRSAEGIDTPPDFILGMSIVDDFVGPFLRLLVVLVACYLPVFVALVLVYRDFLALPAALAYIVIPYHIELEWWQRALWVLGGLYFPMALAGVIVREDFRALLPTEVVRSVRRAFLPTAIVTAALFAVNGGHQAMMVRIDDGKTLPFSAFTTLFLLKVVLLYVYCLLARLLGLACWHYREPLGWFKRL